MKVGEWMQGNVEEGGSGLKWGERARLVMRVLRLGDPAEVLMHEAQELTETELAKLEGMMARRMKGEPLAYVLGEAEFYGRKWQVNPAVLIPRPETEELVRAVVDENRQRWAADGGANESGERRQGDDECEPVVVAEVGVGSGCLIGSVAREIDEAGAELVAVDISEEALRVAEKNLRGMRVKLFQGDLLEGWRSRRDSGDGGFEKDGGELDIVLGKFDIIVANLPYVDKNWEWNSPGLRYEPEVALYAGRGGLELIFRLMTQARSKLKAGGVLILELDKSQKTEVRAELLRFGYVEIAEVGEYGLVAKMPGKSAYP